MFGWLCCSCHRQVERNLQDALHVARNIMVQPFIVAGGGAFEMALQCVSRSHSSASLSRMFRQFRISMDDASGLLTLFIE